MTNVLNRNLLLIIPSRNFNEEEYNITKKNLENCGFRIFISSPGKGLCVGKKGLKVQPDILINNVNEKNFEGIIFIGGRGVLADIKNSMLQDLASAFKRSNKVVAAICAAPLILGNAGMLTNIEATCNKNYRNDLEDTGAKYSEVPAVRSGNIITAQDPESARDFAALIVDQISK